MIEFPGIGGAAAGALGEAGGIDAQPIGTLLRSPNGGASQTQQENSDLQARRKGEADVDNFFVKADSVHEGNHVYHARERMHPDVAQRLDELKAVEDMLVRQRGTPGLDGLLAEVANKRQRLSSDDRSWGAASLIAYQRAVSQDGQSLSVAGVPGTHQSVVEAEREFIFDTIGWANLRQRERDNPPAHLDE